MVSRVGFNAGACRGLLIELICGCDALFQSDHATQSFPTLAPCTHLQCHKKDSAKLNLRSVDKQNAHHSL